MPELKANAIWLYRYMSQAEEGTSKVWWDDVVIAKKYIGPITPASEEARESGHRDRGAPLGRPLESSHQRRARTAGRGAAS